MALCFDKICRTCMIENSAMLSIYESLQPKTNISDNLQSGGVISLTDMLLCLTTVQVNTILNNYNQLL